MLKNIKRIISPMLCILLITAFFLINDTLCNYWTKLELINSYDNTPYNEHAIMFVLGEQESGTVNLSEIAENNILADCALLKYNYGTYKMNEVIYCDDGVIDVTGVEHLDFASSERIAVAGCDTGHNIGDKILEGGREYTIKGILAEHISSAINTGVFFCNSELSKVPSECAYVLTSKNKDAIIKAYTKLEKLIKEQHAELKVIETDRTRFTDYVGYTRLLTLLLAILVLFYIVLIYVFRYSWLKLKMSEILVLKILGDIHIKARIKAEYLTMWIVGFLLSLTIFTLGPGSKCYDFSAIIIVNGCIFVMSAISSIGIYKESKYVL